MKGGGGEGGSLSKRMTNYMWFEKTVAQVVFKLNLHNNFKSDCKQMHDQVHAVPRTMIPMVHK
jgi:hypothetical protein